MRRKMSFALLLSLLVVIALTGCDLISGTGSFSKTGSLNGQVIDSSGEGIRSATVQLSDITNVTDDTGLFSIKDVETGEYTLVVTRDGFETKNKNVTINSGSNNVTVELEKEDSNDDGDDGENNTSEIFQVPVGDITVDGTIDDWANVEKALIDEDEVEVTVQGANLQYIKMALNEERTKLFFLIKTEKEINKDVKYRFWIDNNLDHDIHDKSDRQIEFGFYDFSWEIETQSMSEVWNEIDEKGVVKKAGTALEASINIESTGLNNEFHYSGVTRESSDDWNAYDKFESNYLTKIN